MKKQLLIGLLLLGSLVAGRAGIFYQGTAISGGTDMGAIQNATIADAYPFAIGNTMTLSSLGTAFSSLTVTLNITGGNNSGLYIYLVAPNLSTVVLMNQPGVSPGNFGATGAGMNITLQDGASDHGSIQSETSSSSLSGSYNASVNLSGLTGTPNGAWTLYFADTISGGGPATLNGWSLDITPVPEPVNVALGIFAGIMGLMALARSQLVKRLLARNQKS